MKKTGLYVVLGCCLTGLLQTPALAESAAKKPSPDQVISLLKEGNRRFAEGKSTHPHQDAGRLALAAKENQGNYAYATVLSCSDSRVPVEQIFDAGIMDLFVVRVAGNVVEGHEAGSIEYGLAHVNTPVLVVLGHTQCGAVTAVCNAAKGKGHALESNIPPLVEHIDPAVKKVMRNPKITESAFIPAAIEENVWQSIEDLFMRSAAVREMAKSGEVKVVGAIYDLGTGKVNWLAESRTGEILSRVEKDPRCAKEAMARGAQHAKSH